MTKGFSDFGAANKGVERENEGTGDNVQDNFLGEGNDF